MVSDIYRAGIIAELKVQRELLKRGYNVYHNICDDSGVDLVCEKNNQLFSNKLIRIQVKCARVTCLANKDVDHPIRRYGFRLGNSLVTPDFYICVVPEGYLIMHSDWHKGKAFFWYPDSIRKKHRELLNDWESLDKY